LLAEQVSATLAGLGWTSLTIVRGRQEPGQAEEDRQVLRSTVLHISPSAPAWAQWTLADEPFHLGELPVAWQVSARTHTASAVAEWNAYFTTGVPHEVLADFLLALDARPEPGFGFDGPEAVLDALTGQGWDRDIDHPDTAAKDAGFVSGFTLCLLPPLIQDADPQAEPVGWQAWAEPTFGSPYLWCAAFSASAPPRSGGRFRLLARLAGPGPAPGAARDR
jgi:hypothetical protein